MKLVKTKEFLESAAEHLNKVQTQAVVSLIAMDPEVGNLSSDSDGSRIVEFSDGLFVRYVVGPNKTIIAFLLVYKDGGESNDPQTKEQKAEIRKWLDRILKGMGVRELAEGFFEILKNLFSG